MPGARTLEVFYWSGPAAALCAELRVPYRAFTLGLELAEGKGHAQPAFRPDIPMLVLIWTQFRLALTARVLVLLAIALPVGAQASQNGDRANWPARVNALPLTASPGADSLRAEVAPSMGASSPTAFGLRFGEGIPGSQRSVARALC